MTNHSAFFTTEVPQLLQRLKPETPRLWGSMAAPQMLDHLHAGTVLFMAKRIVPLEVPEEKLERYKAFLMSDKNFGEGAPKPDLYHEYEAAEPGAFQAQKDAFLKTLSTFDDVTQTDPDFWCFHPSFGKLNAEETRQLQYKHIRHHFQQFGLMPR
jgi:oxepin-CoA hydrolase/3-oxo-5,6-dehydrosuberyl-CoA semialdehyde dehydrogenase